MIILRWGATAYVTERVRHLARCMCWVVSCYLIASTSANKYRAVSNRKRKLPSAEIAVLLDASSHSHFDDSKFDHRPANDSDAVIPVCIIFDISNVFNF